MMHNSLTPCETRLEEISLHAAGCLRESESRELREHLGQCAGCQERFVELQNLTGALRTAKPEVDSARVALIEQPLLSLNSDIPRRKRYPVKAFVNAILIAVGILVMVGLFIPFFSRASQPSVARSVDPTLPTPSQVVSDAPVIVVDDSISPSVPTLIALRRAASVSEESLERFLTQCPEHVFNDSSQPLSLRQGAVQ